MQVRKGESWIFFSTGEVCKVSGLEWKCLAF